MLVRASDNEYVVSFSYEEVPWFISHDIDEIAVIKLNDKGDGYHYEYNYYRAYKLLDMMPEWATGVVTKASIRMVNGEVLEPVRDAISLCFPLDIFEKEEGRKNALARALTGFDKKDRLAFWNSYWARSPKTIGRCNELKRGV